MVVISKITLFLAVMLPSVMGAVGNGGISRPCTKNTQLASVDSH